MRRTLRYHQARAPSVHSISAIPTHAAKTTSHSIGDDDPKKKKTAVMPPMGTAQSSVGQVGSPREIQTTAPVNPGKVAKIQSARFPRAVPSSSQIKSARMSSIASTPTIVAISEGSDSRVIGTPLEDDTPSSYDLDS